ncbi:flagellar hook-basal body protein [Paenalkalicoccus suaedae]|uniref:Flagellar hook-basal body protein n=1 Tax=Paenalkalicoccus suaedae TaxID=2592382 RepID=A0A859FI12_9BACI|nr:flagellar hook-basal body protein [Paenalkalicoccus suaedae]QKS72741.1 flagellar hook-basal body protein [Paenalkalicoccus suaedae]
MLRGLYTAGAGMIAQQRRQEMLTNNMANINTPGYKADQATLRTFPNMLVEAMGTDQRFGRERVGELTTGVYLQERLPDFRQGGLLETTNPTDVALMQGVVPQTEDGDDAMLAFQVQNNDGEIRYTRNGNFAIDGQGFLTSPEGNYILGTDGEPIAVQNELFRVERNGEIIDEDENIVGQINVVVISDTAQLVKEGQGFLRYDGDEDIVTAVGNPDTTYQLQQGFVEGSNVNPERSMTEMMATLRSFEANQKFLQAYDQSLERTVNDVGRIG